MLRIKIVTFFKLWIITTLLITDVLSFDASPQQCRPYIFLYLYGVGKAAFNEEVETLPWEPCSVPIDLIFYFSYVILRQTTLDVFKVHCRACEYIFSINTVSLRSDVRQNMAARPVRGHSTSQAYHDSTVPTGVFKS